MSPGVLEHIRPSNFSSGGFDFSGSVNSPAHRGKQTHAQAHVSRRRLVLGTSKRVSTQHSRQVPLTERELAARDRHAQRFRRGSGGGSGGGDGDGGRASRRGSDDAAATPSGDPASGDGDGDGGSSPLRLQDLLSPLYIADDPATLAAGVLADSSQPLTCKEEALMMVLEEMAHTMVREKIEVRRLSMECSWQPTLTTVRCGRVCVLVAA
jgi:hypothetical protein